MSNVPGRKKEMAIVLRMRSRTQQHVSPFLFFSSFLFCLFFLFFLSNSSTFLSRRPLSPLSIHDDDSHGWRDTTAVSFFFFLSFSLEH
ncbi:hypothetical protein PUN28_014745 [Cardiocondyla obscurior]|uniref:Transmembrane protein n=1 Tax=Cardiocondyla obscurior TaxID=286306 RepID=A0AAW2EXG0_9HYME